MLSPKAKEMIDLLVEAAEMYVAERGFNKTPTQVSLFIPQVALADVLGVHAFSIRRWFGKYDQLRKQVAMRRHYTSIKTKDGKTRTVMDGCLFAIRFEPGTRDVRVPLEDLKHQWRNLEGDISAGNTKAAQQGLFESYDSKTIQWSDKLELILRWTLRSLNKDSVTYDSHTVPDAFATGEPSAIANALVTAFQDHHSRRFWYKQASIWLRRGRISTLRAQVERVLVDYREGSVRNPAAVLVHRLSAPRREQQTLFSG